MSLSAADNIEQFQFSRGRWNFFFLKKISFFSEIPADKKQFEFYYTEICSKKINS